MFDRGSFGQFRVGAVASTSLGLAAICLTALRYWLLSEPYPPGLDGAQWLTYGREYFGGVGRAAESAYPPVVPVAAHVLASALGPVTGTRVLATATIILLGAATWLLAARLLGRTWGALVTALVVTSTAFAEPIYYGGYPQQAALGFGMVGLWALAGAAGSRNPQGGTRDLLFAGTCFAFASATHLLYGPLLIASGACAVVLAAITRWPGRRAVLKALATFLPAIAVSALMAWRALQLGYAAPLGATERTLPEAWWYTTREAPWLWAGCITLGGLAAAGVLARRWRVQASGERCEFPIVLVYGLALLIPTGVLFAASGQPRLAPPLLFAGAVLAASLCRSVSATHTAERLSLAIGWGVVSLWLALATTQYARDFASFYQVLNHSLVTSASRLPAGRGAVAVAADHRGWPVGWWYEALQERPVYVGSDPVWLAFPQERERAARVSELLSAPSARVLRQQAASLGISYLVVGKWDWIGWERWLGSPASGIAIAFDDGETLVLRLSPPAQ